MRVFITGASGFIGSALTADLIAAGHQVLGLTRTEAGAKALAAAGAEPLRGTLEQPELLSEGAGACDAVAHLAFNHDFSAYVANCEADRPVIAALAAPLAGTGRPLLVTSGTGMGRTEPGRLSTEDDPPAPAAQIPRAATEEAAAEASGKRTNVGVVRLPQVHDRRRQGLVSPYIQVSLEKGACAYVGDGANRWTAAHVSDVARLYRLALERAQPNAVYNAVAEEAVPMRAIAEALGRRLGLPVRSVTPEEAPAALGWLAMFATNDVPASSAKTRAALNWTPTGPTLIEDLENLQLETT